MIDTTQLYGFTGTERWRKWSALFPRVLLTDGAHYIAENAGENGAYWLMDAIAAYQPELLRVPSLQRFQLWKLEVDTTKHTATLSCQEDSDLTPLVTQEIEYTDFDLPELRLYCMPTGDNKTQVILLPSEY